ncbi:hypothetical protein [Streptomyces yunnanensis]|uniref:Uncharacterized protein n=1 Tax=Streptomyces yunnanensis TaxID=156453 RepID=A0A9X8QYG1_9ACTN|nr:hypothetical protein [Streptomyces yunnanensis]SHN07833.1 hypothetical protein SAMN05216268_11943 [Streptomyces yunnanensis]
MENQLLACREFGRDAPLSQPTRLASPASAGRRAELIQLGFPHPAVYDGMG